MKRLVAKFMLKTGSKRTTAYEYLETLIDAGRIVREETGASSYLWTPEAFEAHEKESKMKGNVSLEASVKGGR